MSADHDHDQSWAICGCAHCIAQGEDASSGWNRSYTIPDPPKIPNPPGSTVTATSAAEAGYTGPRFHTLLRGDDWNDPEVGIPAVVPYTFATRAMSKYSMGSGDPVEQGFEATSGEPLDASQRASIRQALSMYEQVSGLTFVEVSDSDNWNFDGIRFLMESVDLVVTGSSVMDILGLAAPVAGQEYGFNVVFNRLHYADASMARGTDGFYTMMHEIGHAVGLKHPFEGSITLSEKDDKGTNTVMSYKTNGNYDHLGPYDIAAVQHIYGGPEAKATAPIRWAQGPNGSLATIGNDHANVITGISVGDSVYAYGGDDLISTGDGDDRVAPGAGADAVFGGTGVDTLLTGALRWQATIDLGVGADKSVQGTVKLADGMDSFYSVENIGFVDGTLAISNNTATAQVYRLYGAALDRTPDAVGLGHWADAMQNGSVGRSAIASLFANSAEFLLNYGSLGDAGFVSQLYENVLNRPADAAGLRYWTSAMQAGHSRGDVLLGFSESAEYQKTTAGAFAKGVWAVNPEALDVVRAYVGVLDRRPDAGGLMNWTGAREAGMSQFDLVDRLVNSTEFQERFGGLSNRDFVEQMYRTALDRPADPDGAANWTYVLDAGLDNRTGVALGFASSVEMGVKVTPWVATGIWYA